MKIELRKNISPHSLQTNAVKTVFCLALLFVVLLQKTHAAVPPIPTGLTLTPELTSGGLPQMRLDWTASSGATSYRARRHTAASAGTTTQLAPNPTTTTFTDKGSDGDGVPNPLTFNTVYWWNVAAANASGVSTYSTRLSMRTVPAAPTLLSAVGSGAQVSLSWTAPPPGPGPVPTSYNIKRSTSSSGPFTDAQIIGTSPSTTYPDYTAAPNTQYYYVVSAVGSGQGPNSGVAGVLTPPGPPLDVTVTTSANGAPILTWATSAGATSYKVYRSTVGGTLSPVLVGNPTTSPFTEVTAPSEILLYYYIAALNSGGESRPSSTNNAMSTYKRKPKLLISEISANPNGSPDSPKEFVELVATDAIDFSATPYCVVFTSHSSTVLAEENGWLGGCSVTYGFNLTAGTVSRGGVVYVGGDGMILGGLQVGLGKRFRIINTATTAGDRFGDSLNTRVITDANADILGNGGSHADGVAVFSTSIFNLKSGTVPVDALFFGDALGNAIFPGGAAGYELPVNDRYAGGKLQGASYFAPFSPTADQVIMVQTNPSVTFNADQDAFSAVRTWVIGAHTDNTANFTVASTVGAPVFTGVPETFSGVISDSSNPQIAFGVSPTPSSVPTAVSDNAAVVPSANITIIQTGTGQYTLSISPIGTGYANIVVTGTAGGITSNFRLRYAASAAGNANTRFYTFASDASAAFALDSTYMLVGDDEDQVIRLYNRNNSGQPLKVFDFTSALGLAATKKCANNLKEIDIEAATSVILNPGPSQVHRIFWLGALANEDDGDLGPNRNRLFVTDVVGTDLNTYSLKYAGRYDFLRDDLLAWDQRADRTLCDGTPIPANYYGFATSAADQKEPKLIDGFNVEGLAIAPDGITAYIAFRAPYSPPSTRNKALIVPLLNLNALSGNPGGGTLNSAVFGSPIELDLGVRGVRSIEGNGNGMLIVAGAFDNTPNFRLFTWAGTCADQPAERAASLIGMNVEAIVEIPAGSLTENSTVQLLSDNGRSVWYNNGVDAKALPDPVTKFRGDTVTLGAKLNSWDTAAPMSVARAHHTATRLTDGQVLIVGGSSGTTNYLASAEKYDATSGTWTSAGSITGARIAHTATLLSNGKVLVAGGWNAVSYTTYSTSFLYDPSTGIWTSTGNMNAQRDAHTATLLPNGKVLVVSGYNSAAGIWTVSAELYDPSMGTWSFTGAPNYARLGHTATLLTNGKVLIAGGTSPTIGINNKVEVYDPLFGTWTIVGDMANPRYYHSSALLNDGSVLVAGGYNYTGGDIDGAELYNPVSMTWAGTGPLITGRSSAKATLLANGKVLTTGGSGPGWSFNFVANTEVYEPATFSWVSARSLSIGMYAHTSTLLLNGKVLITGGADISQTSLATVLIYSP
jgi:hypothetical protein